MSDTLSSWLHLSVSLTLFISLFLSLFLPLCSSQSYFLFHTLFALLFSPLSISFPYIGIFCFLLLCFLFLISCFPSHQSFSDCVYFFKFFVLFPFPPLLVLQYFYLFIFWISNLPFFFFQLYFYSAPPLSLSMSISSLFSLYIVTFHHLSLFFHPPVSLALSYFPSLCIYPNVCLPVTSCGSRFCSLSVLELIHLESALKHRPAAPPLLFPPLYPFLILSSSFQSVAFSPFFTLPLPVACHHLLDFFLTLFLCFSFDAPTFSVIFLFFVLFLSILCSVFCACCVLL